jgi:hypothetical protein
MDREKFLELIRQHGEDADVEVMRRIFAWADERGMKETWEAGSVHGDGYVPVLKSIEWEPSLLGVATDPPRLFVTGEVLRRHHPFKIEKNWQDVLDRLYQIPNVVQTELGFYPNVLLRDLAKSGIWDRFFRVIDWIEAQVRRSVDLGIK